MKTKYATLIRSLLQNYHIQAKAIDKETYSVHSDGLQLMELNLQLAKCLEGISASARFNNDDADFEELYKIALIAFRGEIPSGSSVLDVASLVSYSVSKKKTVQSVTLEMNEKNGEELKGWKNSTASLN